MVSQIPIRQLSDRFRRRISRDWRVWRNQQRILRLSRQVTQQVQRQAAHSQPADRPVIFFNASTRLTGISLNAAYSLLASWGVQLSGTPVIHYACKAGMSRCVLGMQRDQPASKPPCKTCIAQTSRLLLSAPVVPFTFQIDQDLDVQLASLDLDALSQFDQSWGQIKIPLGNLVLPASRWVLRRHTLNDDEPTRFLLREYIRSAWQIACQFDTLLDQVNPQAVVVFNGQFYPEATVRWVALQRGLRVVTHEVGLRPFTAFFTTGEATAYPLDIPEDFQLSEQQNQQLDDYLAQRFQGQFSMAGIRFWSDMQQLDQAFLEQATRFKQIVPVFTNVIFDTSQPHSNAIFPHMFAWLDMVHDLARQYPETFFVLRAHPDEMRPGKESRESVAEWVVNSKADSLPNLTFIDSHQVLSSYELIQRSKFVMVYNSTIGLEASIMGVPVLCAGKARFTQIPTVFFPSVSQQSQSFFREQAEQFLNADRIPAPVEFQKNARRFLYFQLFRSSLPFEDYLVEDGVWPGFVHFKSFKWQQLQSENSASIKAIVDGIFHGGSFLLPEEVSLR